MKDLERITELIENEIRPLTSKQDISPNELKNLGEAVDILKDVETIKAMKQSEQEGYSFRGSYDDGMSNRYPYMRSHEGGQSMNSYNSYANQRYPMSMEGQSMTGNSMSMQSMDGQSMDSYGRRGRDGDSDGRYSERRGRDAMGRYTSRDSYGRGESYERGYSGHSERQYMIDRLEDMADDARTERERQIIERCIAKLER